MSRVRTGAGFLLWMVLCGACSKHAPPPAHEAPAANVPAAPAAAADATPTFINKVWQVAGPSESARGMLYVFLSTGTLVIHGPHDTPALGTWTQDGGALTMVEEGRPYPVDILALTHSEFRIRIHNPGTPTDIDFVAADGGSAMAGGRPHGPAALWGTGWQLVDWGGTTAAAGLEATLEFPATGKVAGKGSCNRFFGSVEVSADTIHFGPLGSTRMACAEPAATQEARYLKALEAGRRFAREGSTLLLYCDGMDKPLRFVRKEP